MTANHSENDQTLAAKNEGWDNPQMNDPQPVSPRRRMQELLDIPDNQRTEAEWDELNELEIQLAPVNREGAPEPRGQRSGQAPRPRQQQRPPPQQVSHNNAQPGGGASQQPKRTVKRFRRRPPKAASQPS
ncbi:MAG: hypothetical protein H6R18_87 [Proteobacteria bacterium]|nr:hypothetical protein [Pseudomonadota bacterium]